MEAENSSIKNKRIAKNTLFLYVRMFFILIVSLYTSRVILTTLGVSDYGVYNVIAGFVSMFAFLNASFTACIQRFYNFEAGKNGKEQITKVFVSSCVIQLVIAVIVLILLETVGLWFVSNKLVIPTERIDAAIVLFHCVSASLLLVILQIPFSAAIVSYEKMDYYAIVGIIDILLKLGIVLILPYSPYDKLITYSVLLVCVSIVDFLLYSSYSFIKLKEICFSEKYDKNLVKEMLSFSGWSLFGSFSQVARNQGLNILLNIFFGPVVNAARGLSYQVKAAVASLIANVSTAAQPQIVDAYASGQGQRSIHLTCTISKICFFLLLMMVIPLCLNMNMVLSLWLGKENVPEFTYIFTILILIISSIDVFNGPITIMIYATGKIKYYNIGTSLLGLLILPIAYLVLKLGGSPVSVYIISLFISCSVQLYSIIMLKKTVDYPVKQYFSHIIKPSVLVAFLSLGFVIIVNMFLTEGWLKLILTTVVSIICVAVFSFLIGLDNQEKSVLKLTLGRFLNRNNHAVVE